MALLSNVSIEGILEYAGLRKIPKYGVAFGGGGAKDSHTSELSRHSTGSESSRKYCPESRQVL